MLSPGSRQKFKFCRVPVPRHSAKPTSNVDGSYFFAECGLGTRQRLCRASIFGTRQRNFCRQNLCRETFAECSTRQSLCRVLGWLCRVPPALGKEGICSCGSPNVSIGAWRPSFAASSMLCPSGWSQWLSLSEYGYNTSPHSTLGGSPFEVLYGLPPCHLGLDLPLASPAPELQTWLEEHAVMHDLVHQHLLRA